MSLADGSMNVVDAYTVTLRMYFYDGWDFLIRSLRPVSLNKDWSLAMQYIPYAQTHDGASQIEMCAHLLKELSHSCVQRPQ